MKTPNRSLKLSMVPYFAALVLGIPATLQAQTNGTWSNLAGSSWGTATNWTGSAIAAGADAVADFSTLNITAARTITLDGARTVGLLRFGDATTVNVDQTINTGTAGPLTLDSTTGTGIIEVLNRTVTIGAVLAGTDGITVNNGVSTGGTLILGAANTFTGGLTVQGAIVQFNNNASAGAGSNNPINILGSGSTAVSRVLANGGVTNASPITIESTTNVAGFGVLQQTGTGLGTFSGPITVNGAPSAGGHFVGGTAAGNALVLSGPITSGVTLVQRDGFVRYGGGGTGYTLLLVTNTAQVGATNGIATTATLNLGPSNPGTLDLNGFDQTLAAVNMGYNINPTAFPGTINLGARTLTMEGDITTGEQGGTALAHAINAAAGGTLNAGATSRNLVVNDNPAPDDLVVTNAALAGSGGFIKTGAGTLSLNNTTATGPLFIDQGTLAIGRTGLPGSFSVAALTFADGTTLKVDAGLAGDVATAGPVTNTGTTIVSVNQIGGILANGDYPILNYTGTSPGLSGFALNTVGHSTSSLVDTGTSIALRVTGNKRLVWDGTAGNAWITGPTGNWKVDATAADYIESDDVVFPTGPLSSGVDIQQPVSPSLVTFENSTATEYTVSGSFGITGGTSLVKNGTGKVILQTNNSYLGATSLNQGMLELDHDAPGNAVLTGSSGVSTAPSTILQLTRDDGGFTFSRNLSGPASLQINPHSVAGGSAAHSVVLSGTNTGFSGSLQLQSPLSGTWRIQSVQPAGLGSGAIEVQDGAQLYTATGQTYLNPITIAGNGYADTGGNIGALRLENTSIWAGPVVLSGTARIGSHNGTGTISGPISGGDLSANATNFNNNYTLIFTGANSYGTTTIGGENFQTAGVPSMRLNIGANGTTGTLGTGPVIINGDGANGILGFDRTDGYTLATGQTLTGAGFNLTRTIIDVDTRGTGLSQNGQAITLGDAGPLLGGQIRIAQGRAGSILNTNGVVTAEQLRVSTGQTGGVLNINAGSAVTANAFNLGEVANGSALVNQAAGSSVTVVGQLRCGHFGTETGIYNLNGGTLTLTGDSPNLSPSTAGAGGANATGDNNLNALPANTVVGGGIYLGIDGNGIFNHNSGSVTTNWIVLDNRGNSGAGANMATGIDEYNLNAGTLSIRSNWGILQRNTSAAFNLGGGTVRIDNTGTGPGTGIDLTIPVDAEITVSGTGSAFDTNGPTNSFNLTRNILGTGTLALTGGGSIQLSPPGVQTISAALSGTAPLTKAGAGTTFITGSIGGYTGPVSVQSGRLELPASAAPSSVAVLPVAALGGEFATASLALDSSTLFFDPTTPGGITATSLSVTGTVLLDFSKSPLADGTYTVITYGSKTGGGNFAFTGAAGYRSIAVTDTGTQIRVTLGGTKALTWQGTGSSSWDIDSTTSWNNSDPAADKFFLGDSVLFTDAATQLNVPITDGVAPASTRVNSDTNNYTFTTAATGIAGGGSLIKEGTSTLTLAGPNTYAGRTVISGGTLGISNQNSLGSGVAGNSILLQGGGRLSYNGSAAIDFGLNRDIAVGTGGGSISHNNATAATLTIPGRLSGSDALSLRSNVAGAGSFVLTGNNSGYSGALSVDAPTAGTGGLTVLRPAAQQAVPLSGSITLNYPATGANGNATTLDLPNVTLPAGLGVNLTSLQSGAISLRTQITNTGNSVINGPITLGGNSIIQLTIPSGSMTLNGNVTEGGSGFTGTMFIRGGGGNGFINGNINLPSATFAKTDANNWWINSNGHSWLNTSIVVGTVTLGISDALVPTAPLVLGQNDANAVTVNLNGFNQTVASLASNPTAVGTNTTGKAITSATPSVFTVSQFSSTTYAGLMTGSVSFVKDGSGTLTLSGASTFTGNVTINDGTINAAGATVTSLGSATAGGRTITVNAPALLNFNTNNVYGNGVGNLNLPATTVNGTTLHTTRYNVLGPVTLDSAILSQGSTDSGSYEGFQFRGGVNVAGSALSTILSVNGKANHLGPDTVFTVADAVAGSGTDLLVSATLRNQSGDFGLAVASLTKAGPGTMELDRDSTYTGTTSINGGTLRVNNPAGSATGGSAVAVNNGGTLAGAGSVGGSLTVNAGGVLSPGNSAGTLNTALTTLAGGSAIVWEVSDWTGSAGTGYDVLNATTLAITATPSAPVVIRVSQVALANFTAANRSFTLATTTGITGFDAAAFVVDTSGFSAGNGSWSVTQSGNDLVLNYSATPGSSPYDLWASANGLAGADAAFTADPDKDSSINLAEFALNSNPKAAADSGKVRVAVANLAGQDYLTLTLPVRTGIAFTGATELSGTGSGIRYRIQGDPDLSLWTGDVDEVAPALSAGLPLLETGWTYRTFRIAAPITAGARQFLRSKFEVAAP